MFNTSGVFKSDPLNYMRVFAAALVFFLHIRITSAAMGYSVTYDFEILMVTPAWAGVWIFLILGGYLAGKGFFEHRYSYSLTGIIKYYLTRWIKVIFPTLIFIMICCVLCYPGFVFNSPEVIIQFLCCTYNGIPGISGIGATWYVFTIFWLYLITPVVCYIIDYIDSKLLKKNWLTIFIVILFLGLSYREFCLSSGADWYTLVYTNPWSNLDLFIGGIILNKIIVHREIVPNKIGKVTSVLSLIFLYVVNCVYYYQSDEDNFFLILYMYRFETLWLIVVSLIIVNFSDFKQKEDRNKFLINKFAGISFEFYLFHSLIAACIYTQVDYSNPLIGHLVLLCSTFILTVLFSILFKYSTKPIVKIMLSYVKRIKAE